MNQRTEQHSQNESETGKKLDKYVFHTIKTAIDYLPKLAWNKISDANFCKLA